MKEDNGDKLTGLTELRLETQLRAADGKLAAGMDEAEKAEASALMAQINALPGVLTLLSVDEVYIRRFRIVGDKLNNQGGRFRTEDLPALLAMTNGAPMLVGHKLDEAPVGRFFGGDVVEADGAKFIRPNIYWPRGMEGAEILRVGIDTGIYGEGSLSFKFAQGTCSICGLDIMGRANSDGLTCPHIPGVAYNGVPCYFWYERVSEVREGSLVYRGAHPGTGFEAALAEKAAQHRVHGEHEEKNKTDFPLKGKAGLTGGQEMEKEAIALAVKELGLAGDCVDEAALVAACKAELGALRGKVEALKPEAEAGQKSIQALRAEVLEMDVRARALRKGTPIAQPKSFQELVGQAGWGLLSDLKTEREAEVSAGAGEYKCPGCGAKLTGLRHSAEEDVERPAAAVSQRGENLDGVRI